MIRIVFIGKNEKRINVLKNYDYVIDEIEWGDGYSFDKVIDLFIVQHDCNCADVCEFLHNNKRLSHIPIICLVSNINVIESSIYSDLIISDMQSDVEYMCQVKTLVKMKLTDDELKKEKIVLELKIKDRTNELKNKAERLNITLNSIGDGVIVTDKDGLITTMNPVAMELTELNDDEFIGKHIDEVIYIELHSIRTRIFDMVMTSKRVCHIDDDSVLISKSGQRIHISDSASPIFDKNGNMNGIVVVFKDNTVEYQMKSELKQKEERYRQIYDNVPDAIYTLTFDGVFTSLNTTLDFGYNVDEIIGRNICEFMDEANINIMYNNINYKMKSPHEITQYEIDIIQKDGVVNPMEIKSYFTFDENGNPKEIFGIARSIKDRRKYLNMLKMHNERYGSLFKNMGKMLGVLRKNGEKFIFSECNDMFLNIENKTGGVNGKELYEAVPEYRAFEFSEKLKQVWDTEESLTINEVSIMVDGKRKWRRFFIYKLNSTDEIAFIGDDITEYKEFSEKLQLEKNRAEESDKLKTTFLTNMSHEIRTPLNLIMGYSQLITKETISKEDKLKNMQIIDTNGKLLLDIIDSIIDLSKIQSNTIKITKENTDANKILFDSLYEYNKIATDRHKSHLSINFINKREILRIYTDKYKLKQILNNLIINAIKFTNNGYINYGYFLKNDTVVFYVKDSGRGISETEKAIIFERFVKIHNKNEKPIEGMGIGLTITKSLVEMLGGNIWVESDGVHGSDFYFTIPFTQNNCIGSEKTTSPKYNWSGKKMGLIVTDDKIFTYYQMIFKINNIDITIFDRHIIDYYDVILIDKDEDDMSHYTDVINTGKCIVLRYDDYKYHSKPIKLNKLKELINEKLD